MAYSWQDVMLGIDIREEGLREQEEARKISEMQAKENTAAGLYSLGLSIIGGSIFGAPGYAFGKMLGRGIADWQYDWEDMELTPGKFYKEEEREYARTKKQAADDQTTAQITQGLVDLGAAYIQSGGLTAEPGEWDPFTFGSGEEAWTVFGEETNIPFTNIDMPGVQLPQDQSLFGGWEKGEGLWQNIKNVAPGIGKKFQSLKPPEVAAGSIADLVN